LEEQINGVEGMTYMTSSARNDGSAQIQIFFTLDTDPNMAAVNVQNRVSAASSSLPAEVTSMGVTTNKKQNSMVVVVSMYSTNSDHDETFLQNYARINVLPELQRVKGVGDVSVFGSKDFSMRIWLNPDKLNSYKLTPADVQAAIQEQSRELTPGKFGNNSDQVFQYTIQYKGRLSTVAEYENIIIRVGKNGEILRLKDVARVEFGAFNYDMIASAQGVPGVVMAVYQMKGSNSQEICNEIKARMINLQKSFPSGMQYRYVVDTQDFLDASIHEVIKTLIEAFILVFIVVFIFLQHFKSTIIPAISASVAIIGSFLFLSLFGFSINLLTL
ncbi:MAG: efflux RND transporter permease subunit, partial [Bacteroidales bacterium]